MNRRIFLTQAFNEALKQDCKVARWFSTPDIAHLPLFKEDDLGRGIIVGWFVALIHNNNRISCKHNVFRDCYNQISMILVSDMIIIDSLCEHYLTDAQVRHISKFRKLSRFLLSDIDKDSHTVFNKILDHLLNFKNSNEIYEFIEQYLADKPLMKERISGLLDFCNYFNKDAEYLINVLNVSGEYL